MDTDAKLTVFGNVSASLTSDEQAVKNITTLWELGYVRMTPEDIELLTANIKAHRKLLNKLEEYRDKFDGIKVEIVNS